MQPRAWRRLTSTAGLLGRACQRLTCTAGLHRSFIFVPQNVQLSLSCRHVLRDHAPLMDTLQFDICTHFPVRKMTSCVNAG